MLPKPIKNLKSSTGEQLDLVNTISNEDKIKNKRRAIIIFLALTVGLSFIFWIYRSVNLFIKNPTLPKITLNFDSFKINKLKINVPSFNNSSLEKSINPIISQDTNIWSIHVQSIKNQNVTFFWSKNYVPIPEEIDKIINNLSQVSISNNTPVSSNLPPGVQVQEASVSNSDSYQLQTLITVPQQQFLLVFKITGSKIDTAIKLIPEVVEKIYWYLIQLV